jgi:hypothetical protein
MMGAESSVPFDNWHESLEGWVGLIHLGMNCCSGNDVKVSWTGFHVMASTAINNRINMTC